MALDKFSPPPFVYQIRGFSLGSAHYEHVSPKLRNGRGSFVVYPSVLNLIGMKTLLVVAALSWHMEGGLALASAAFAFVSTSLETSALLKSHTTHNLATLMTGPRRLSRTSAISASRLSPSYRYSGKRRRKYPASLQLINPRSTAFHYTQQRCFFGHRSDLLTTISCLQSICSSWNISLNGRESSRAPYGACPCTMLLRDTVTTPHRRCSDGKERQILSLASSSSTGNWGSTPGYRRKPPEEEDIWSKSSVFEFRSVNDPDTNTSMYRRGSDDDSKDSPALKKTRQRYQQSESEPYQTEYAEEAIPVDTPPTFMTPESAENDWFRFQEKEHLVQPRVNNVSGGVSGDAKVELSTQLGLPATATHEELRTEYVAEVKRCHPDMAGDNEFRAKMLERRFQRLTAAWDLYTEELRKPSPQQPTTRFAESFQEFSTDTITETEACVESDEIARDRARERARAEYLKAEAKARAATAAKQYTSGMDPGRKYLDTGASSC